MIGLRRRPRATAQGAARDDRPAIPRRGQALVEFAILLPLFLMILLGLMEFGLAFSHHITLEYATREGARTGAALANGSVVFDCDVVDDRVVAAVQRVLTSNGSQVELNNVGEIRIYKAAADGKETGPVDIWKLGSGPVIDGAALLFKRVSNTWDACARNNDGFGMTDSLGVSLVYDYQYVTPLGSLLGYVGTPTMHMSDRTVMALNPD